MAPAGPTLSTTAGQRPITCDPSRCTLRSLSCHRSVRERSLRKGSRPRSCRTRRRNTQSIPLPFPRTRSWCRQNSPKWKSTSDRPPKCRRRSRTKCTIVGAKGHKKYHMFPPKYTRRARYLKAVGTVDGTAGYRSFRQRHRRYRRSRCTSRLSHNPSPMSTLPRIPGRLASRTRCCHSRYSSRTADCRSRIAACRRSRVDQSSRILQSRNQKYRPCSTIDRLREYQSTRRLRHTGCCQYSSHRWRLSLESSIL